MLVKSKIKEGLVIGDFKGVKGSNKSIDNLVNTLVNMDDLNFEFKIDKGYYTILPIITHYSLYGDDNRISTKAIYKYINNVIATDYTLGSKDAYSIYTLMKLAHEIPNKVYSELVKNNDFTRNLSLCARYLYNIGALADRRDEAVNKEVYKNSEKLKLMAVETAFYNMVGFLYSLRYANSKEYIARSIINLAYRLEDMLTLISSDIDVRLCEFMYLVLRKYLSSKLGDKIVFGIDLYADFKDYGDAIDDYMEGISNFIVPMTTTPHGKLVYSEIYMGVHNIMESVNSRLHYEILTNCKDILDVTKSDAENTIKEYKFTIKSKDKEIQSLRSELKAKDKEVKYANKKIAKLEDVSNTVILKNRVAELEDMVKKLEGKLEQKDARINSLESKQSEVEVSKGVVEEVNPVETKPIVEVLSFEEKVNTLKDKRYVVIGGNSTLERSLKGLLPNIVFKKDSLHFEISSKVDYVLLYTKNIGHSNTYKANTFSNSVKGIIPLYNSNIAKVVDSIYKYIQSESVVELQN